LLETFSLASVLVVTKNNKDIIDRNLRSIFYQSYDNIEVVIIDSSDDESEQIIKQCIRNVNKKNFDVKYVHTKPKGVGAARNMAILACSGDYIIFLDADCYLPEDYVARAMELFLQDDKILTINITIKHDSKEKGLFARVLYLYDRARMRALGSSSKEDYFNFLTCRKQVFDLVGFFDDGLEAGEDLEWIARSEKCYKRSKSKGYKSVASDIVMFEEKGAWSLSQYWRKCLWYGGAFADFDYLKTGILPMAELFLMFTQVTYPVSLLLLLLHTLSYTFFIAHTLIFLAPTFYIIYKVCKQKNPSSILALIPLLIFYKSFFLLLGAMSKLCGKFRGSFGDAFR